MSDPAWPERRERLLKKAKELPMKPGVYTFRDAKGQPVYIGKARNLRSRVSSYFRENADDGRPLFPFIVTSTEDLVFLVVDTEKEALLLENSLIKQLKPRFNVMLTDDKSYLSIKVTRQESWPRVQLVRRARKDGALYFGPYASASEARDITRVIKKHFTLRTCSNAEFRQRKRPCLEYQMGRCQAPCVGLQTEYDYLKTVDDVVLFLKGKTEELGERLQGRMKAHAAKLEFEQAARVRDELKALKVLKQKQNVARAGVFVNQDAFGITQVGAMTLVRILHIRRGQVADSTTIKLDLTLPREILLNSVLSQFYQGDRPMPDEVLLPFAVEDEELLAAMWSEQHSRKVKIQVPQRGSRASLVAMAMKNASAVLATESEAKKAMQAVLEALQDGLQLKQFPEIIECYDISTIQGSFTVGSMVRFEMGREQRHLFRNYKITSIDGQDDFASMREVLSRRFAPHKAMKLGPLPQLVVIDGGKGQLGVAHGVVANLVPSYQAGDMTVVGLAKARAKKNSQERVFFPNRSAPVVLIQDSPELRLLARIRDAAHDHAINYHRHIRRKKFLKTGLDEIPGVGPGRRKALLKHFGNLKGIRDADLATLKQVKGIPDKVAQAVFEFFQSQ